MLANVDGMEISVVVVNVLVSKRIGFKNWIRILSKTLNGDVAQVIKSNQVFFLKFFHSTMHLLLVLFQGLLLVATTIFVGFATRKVILKNRQPIRFLVQCGLILILKY